MELWWFKLRGWDWVLQYFQQSSVAKLYVRPPEVLEVLCHYAKLLTSQKCCVFCLLLPALHAVQSDGCVVCIKRFFLGFLPCGSAGATHCTDGVKFSMEELPTGPSKLKILPKFWQILEYKCTAGANSLHNFYEICGICTPFQDDLAVKIWMESLEGYRVMGVLIWACWFSPKFSAPPNCETIRQTLKVLEEQEHARGPLSTAEFGESWTIATKNVEFLAESLYIQ